MSNVCHTNMRTTLTGNLLQKLERSVKKADMIDIDFNSKYTVIKIRLGEPGNLIYPRVNYSKVLVNLIRSQSGKVFLTDCSTLYVGRRRNTLDHLNAVYESGYNPFTARCHMIIADGLKRADEALISIDGEHMKEARIGRAIVGVDIAISLTRFKEHEATGFRGTLRNLGMGSGSRADKMEMYNVGKPFVHTDKCTGHGACQRNCVHSAITVLEHKASIGTSKRAGYGRCIRACSVDAVDSMCDETNDILNRKIAEYTLTVLKGRPNFHMSLVVDISPNCDCYSENDAPTVPSTGMFASFDSVALNMICMDTVNSRSVLAGSSLAERDHHGHDYFINTHPDTNWGACIDHAVKLGLGNKKYNLITI